MLRMRFLLLLVVISAVFAAALGAWSEHRQNKLDRVVATTRQHQTKAAQTVIKLESTGLDTLAKDYTYWDDMVAFVQHPTKQFADENLVPCLNTFNVDAVWVYDLHGKLIYSLRRPNLTGLESFRPLTGDVPDAFSPEKQRRFFKATADGLIEMRASTINRTNDPERKGTTYGYFVAGRVWDRTWMAQIRSVIDARIELVSADTAISTISGATDADSLESLRDEEGRVVGKMYISSRSGVVQLVEDAEKNEMAWLLTFAMVVLGVVSLCISRWVSYPIRAITKGLETGDTHALDPIRQKKTEFGRLAQLVGDFFAQKASLEKEIEFRKRTQAELLKIRKAVDSASDAVTIADAHGRVIYVNRAYKQLFGYTAEEVTAMGGFGALLGEELRSVVRERVLSGQLWDGEGQAASKNGEEIPISWRTTGVKDENGEIVGMISVVSDMREKRQLQRRVLQAEKLAALGELVAGVAHEINNPLAVISAHAQLLELNSSKAVREDGMTIKRMADRAHRIIHSLLTFSRENPIDKKRTPLRVPIEAALEMVDYRFKKKGVDLRVEIESGGPSAWINEQQIQQVVLNLLNNAEHAVGANEQGNRLVILWSGIQVAEDGNKRAIIKITDNGAGMDQETMLRIFDPFFTTKDIGEGTGLGLAICHGIVVEHSGTIDVQSEPGRGTTFLVSFAESSDQEQAA